ncbi:MAG: hypothetical protein ABW175_25175 [Bradyrhizobium sp.]
MKGLTGIAVAGLIAAAGWMWFQTNPNVVTVKVQPLQPNPNLPTFKQVETGLQGSVR